MSEQPDQLQWYRDLVATLSGKELEVLILASKGLTDKQIAAHIERSPFTVNAHMVGIFKKLEVNTRTEAAVIAAKAGIV